ncbi:MAG TPA: sigma factor-like helix-turn-helix DNA-binding protein [Ktedonobacterales bacterium]|nr:sigma factor-like helix-turn-helix DNA-binding protein [Ktedonobacterales bacterium]
MDESDGQRRAHVWSEKTPAPLNAGSARTNRPDARADAREPAPPDVLELSADDTFELDPLALRFPGTTPDIITPEWVRFQARQLIKEFLSAVPRSEADTSLSFLRPDGTTRILTRAQLSAAIDLLRPRQRQIVRLAVEDRWPYKRVCAYLNNISPRTVERDLAEALDLLAQL